MSRRHRRKPTGAPELRDPSAYGVNQVEEHPDGDWVVRRLTGSASAKVYRCPGCAQEIRPATPHVVAWRADVRGGEDDRRHWHTACWNSRQRRGPNTTRSRNAPRN